MVALSTLLQIILDLGAVTVGMLEHLALEKQDLLLARIDDVVQGIVLFL